MSSPQPARRWASAVPTGGRLSQLMRQTRQLNRKDRVALRCPLGCHSATWRAMGRRPNLGPSLPFFYKLMYLFTSYYYY